MYRTTKIFLFCVTVTQLFIFKTNAYDIKYIDERIVDKNVVLQYDEMIKKIMNNFDKLKNEDEKRKALVTLGELKAEQAIPFLIKHLSFCPTELKYTAGLTPAEYALVLIGPAATQQVLEVIKSYSKDSHYNLRQRASLLLFISQPRSLGKKICIMLIQNEAKKTTDKSVLKNLMEAEKIIKGWHWNNEDY